MKKIKGFLVTVVAGLFFLNFSYANEGDNFQKRKLIVEQWLAAGDEVAQKNNNEDARVILDFLRNSFFICSPVFSKAGRAVKVIQEPEEKQYYLSVVPLISGDEKVSKEWEEACQSNLAAFFVPSPEQPQIVLKENSQFSKTWQGLILIHEGGHALAFATGIFDKIKDPLEKRVMDELYAYSLECELIQELGGIAYQKILQEEIKRLESNYLKDGRIAVPDYDRYRASLDKIFGKSKSNLEVGVRGSIHWINAVFGLMDKTYKSKTEREKHKMDFLRSLYKNGNME